MSDRVWTELDVRCLRGLATVVHFPPQLEAPLEAALRVLLAPFVESEERWGERCVKRFLVQFVVEARLGERSGQLSLHHRQRVPPEQRYELEGTIVRILNELTSSAG